MSEQMNEGAEQIGTSGNEGASEPIYRGIQKDIKDQKELADYALQLERQNIEMQARLSGLGAAASAPAESTTDDDQTFKQQFAEKVIIDPSAAAMMLERRIETKMSKVQAEREFWRDFYDKNEDFVGNEDLVDSVLARNQARWKNVPAEQAKRLLAEAVRDRVKAIRGQGAPDRTTELPDRAARNLPVSGASAPARSGGGQSAQGSEPTTIAGALKAERMRRQGRRTG